MPERDKATYPTEAGWNLHLKLQALEEQKEQVSPAPQTPPAPPAPRNIDDAPHVHPPIEGMPPWAGLGVDNAVPLLDGTASPSLERDSVVNGVLARLRSDVLWAYTEYCGKSVPKPRPNQRDGILLSCPIPGHTDKDPSCSFNIDKNQWKCFSCNVGGDGPIIAALHFGLEVDFSRGGKNESKIKDFHGLMQKIAEQHGFITEFHPGGLGEVVKKVELEEDLAPPPIPKTTITTQPVVKLSPKEIARGTPKVIKEDESKPSINWKEIFPVNTFGHEYMETHANTDVPEEFYFAGVLTALACIVGRDVHLYDNPLVYCNLFICIFGDTASGKSRANRSLNTVFKEAAPFNHMDRPPRGVKPIGTPASGEAWIKGFEHTYTTTGPYGPITVHSPVRGYVEFSEFQELAASSSLSFSKMKSIAIRMFDNEHIISSNTNTSDRDRFAKDPLCSLMTTTQPDVLSDLLSQADEVSGFANRFLFISGRTKESEFIHSYVPNLAESIRLLKEIHTWCSSAGGLRVDWNAESQKVMEDAFHNPPLNIFALRTKFIKAKDTRYARIDLIMKKLCLALAINERSTVITKSIAERVLLLWPYLQACYEIQAASMKIDEFDEEILRTIKKLDEEKNVKLKAGVAPIPGVWLGRDIYRRISRKFKDAKRGGGTVKCNQHLQALVIQGDLKTHQVKNSKGEITLRYEIVE